MIIDIKDLLNARSKYIKFPYEHVLGMELSFSKRGVPQIGGFHHDYRSIVEKSGIFEFTNKIVKKNGVYRAKVWHNGNFVKEITFFPADWPPERVIQAICEAYDDFIGKGAHFEMLPDGKYWIKGSTNAGIKIEMYITKKAKNVTAYPVIESI